MFRVLNVLQVRRLKRPQERGAPWSDVVSSVQSGPIVAVVEMTGEKCVGESVQVIK